MLYRSDPNIITILLNIKRHMDKDYDFMLGIVGGTGDGKSRFALNLFETWYRVILQRPVTKDMMFQVSQGYANWVKSFKDLEPYDMSIFDESSRDLNSLDFMTKISKDMNKLFDVFRCKRFFSVVLLPKFFRLNKAVREDRLRGLIHITKRGEYKFYTREDLVWVNAMNEGKNVKIIGRANATHHGNFPDYDGILLNEYIKQKDEGVDEVLDEVIAGIEEQLSPPKKRKTMTEIYRNEVLEMLNDGIPQVEIGKRLDISLGTINKIRVEERMKRQEEREKLDKK